MAIPRLTSFISLAISSLDAGTKILRRTVRMSSVTRGRRELGDAVFSWKDVLVFAFVVRMCCCSSGGEMKL